MNDIKLIALDLDGTLLREDHMTLSPENCAALTEMAGRGIEIVVATGRSLSAVAPAVMALPFIRYFITCNGSVITDREGDILASAPLAPATAEDLLTHLARDDSYALQLYANGKMFISRAQWDDRERLALPEFHIRVLQEHPECVVEDLKEILRQPDITVEKVNLPYLPPEKRGAIRRWVQETYQGAVRIVSTLHYNLELNDRRACKGEALLQICDLLGLSPNETMAFGDGENDIELLQNAGIGIAMGNADPEVKTAADWVTLTNEESGVAYGIRHFLG